MNSERSATTQPLDNASIAQIKANADLLLAQDHMTISAPWLSQICAMALGEWLQSENAGKAEVTGGGAFAWIEEAADVLKHSLHRVEPDHDRISAPSSGALKINATWDADKTITFESVEDAGKVMDAIQAAWQSVPPAVGVTGYYGIEMALAWLRGALDCPKWSWDGDQRDAAEESFKVASAELKALLSAPSATTRNTALADKVGEYASLKANWDSYEAEAFPERTIELAYSVALTLPADWKCVPCADGPSVEFYRGDEDEIINVRANPPDRHAKDQEPK